MKELTILGEWTPHAQMQIASYSTPQEIKSFTTKLLHRQKSTVTELGPQLRALLEQTAFGRQLSQKNSTGFGGECLIESETPLFVNGKNNIEVR